MAGANNLRLRGGLRTATESRNIYVEQVGGPFSHVAVVEEDMYKRRGVLGQFGYLLWRCMGFEAREIRRLNEALFVAARTGNATLCRALVARGAQVDSESVDAGSSPARYYYDLYGLTFYEKDKTPSGPSHAPPPRANAGRTPLRFAAWKGHAVAAAALLELGADVNASDPDGWTAVHEAAMFNHTEALLVLLEHGADVDAETGRGWTALHLAAAFGQLPAVQLLIRAGADLTRTTEGGLTALDWSRGYAWDEVSEFLRAEGVRRGAAGEMSNFFVEGGISTKISSM